jgi:dihydrofolate reductase
MWNGLLTAGLVDELHLVIGGVVLGGGTRAFPEGTAARLELLDTRTVECSDNLIVQYAVVPA